MTDREPPPPEFEFGDYVHRRADPSCSLGWCGAARYPKPCTEPGCTGLVHANFGEESWDGYSLNTRCDACGESE